MTHHSLSDTPNPNKASLSTEIAQQTAAWEKSGGKVQQVPFGKVKGESDLMRQYPGEKGK